MASEHRSDIVWSNMAEEGGGWVADQKDGGLSPSTAGANIVWPLPFTLLGYMSNQPTNQQVKRGLVSGCLTGLTQYNHAETNSTLILATAPFWKKKKSNTLIMAAISFFYSTAYSMVCEDIWRF